MNTAQQLAHSYAQHPRFRFDEAPLPLDPALAAAFDAAYADACNAGAQPGTGEFVAQRTACATCLNAIFDSLSAQADEPRMHQFLVELHAECTRLLAEEIDERQRCAQASRIVPHDDRSRAKLAALQQDCHYFDALPGDAVGEILRVGADDLARFRANAGQSRLTRDDLSVNQGPAIGRIARVLNAHFRERGTLDAVSAYMGRAMSVSGLALELSVSKATWWANAFEGLARPPHTLYAHLDESIAFPKSIIYLTNVGPDNGPTSCYPGLYRALDLRPLQDIVGRVIAYVGSRPASPLHELYRKQYHQSMTSEPFRRHFMRLPEPMRFNSHFGWDVCPDTPLERSLGERERVMTGPAGTHIVFDGARLLHRGGMVARGERIALQVIFSTTPTLRSRIAGRIKRAFA